LNFTAPDAVTPTVFSESAAGRVR